MGLDQILLITGFGGAAASGPKNTVRPEVTGTAEETETLTCSEGTWTGTGTITFAYQWFRGGVAISGETSSTYVVTLADRGSLLSCKVTATDDDGSRSRRSNSVGPVPITLFMLLETGDFLLLETGDRLKLETSA
jgi:hypothetical protein